MVPICSVKSTESITLTVGIMSDEGSNKGPIEESLQNDDPKLVLPSFTALERLPSPKFEPNAVNMTPPLGGPNDIVDGDIIGMS
jgi:hypothetical protein